MKLYFSPGACSLHPHITLREAGIPFELVRVDIRVHRTVPRTGEGVDFYGVNPKGYVPALELDDGEILTEGAIIDLYVADLRPEAKLAPPAGTMARYRTEEWLHFIAMEIHRPFGPLFGTSEEAKALARTRIGKRFEHVAKAMAGRPYLMGETFTVPDGYLYNMLRWAHFRAIDLGEWPPLQALYARIEERPAVQAALAAEK